MRSHGMLKQNFYLKLEGIIEISLERHVYESVDNRRLTLVIFKKRQKITFLQ